MQQDSTQLELNGIHRSVNISLLFATVVFIVLVGGYTCWFWFLNDIPLSKDSSIWGTFGDFVGGILNPIIAFLAFYWLTRSVIIQKTELAATQKVLAETEKATREQAKTQEKKRFEDSFYSLLEQLNSIYNSLNEQNPSQQNNSSKIRYLYNYVISSSKGDLQKRHNLMKDELDCSHYFRVLYQLLKFVAMNFDYESKPRDFSDAISRKLTPDEKLYSNIIRAFLGQDIIQLLAVNCAVTDQTSDYYRYKLLVERYMLLEHLAIEESEIEDFSNIYDKRAFGEHPLFK